MFPSLPPITRWLILANVSVFLLEFVIGGRLLALFALWPLGPLFHPWQLVTYAFLHEPNNLMHIVFNMFALYMFGGAMEMYWRQRGAPTFYVMYYFVSVLAAAGTGMDKIYNFDLSDGDQLDLQNALAATHWDGKLSDLSHFLTTETVGGNTLLQCTTASGGTATVAELMGTNYSLHMLEAHNSLLLA